MPISARELREFLDFVREATQKTDNLDKLKELSVACDIIKYAIQDKINLINAKSKKD